MKKRLVPVRVDGQLPPAGTPISRAGRDAGELRSGAGDMALALLRLEQLANTAAGPLMAGDARLSPAPPPWLVLPA